MSQKYYFNAISKSSIVEMNTLCNIFVNFDQNIINVSYKDEYEQNKKVNIKGKIIFDIFSKEIIIEEKIQMKIQYHIFTDVELIEFSQNEKRK